ncbi:MAG: VIT1/CCC1 transporter family protein [Bacilli bacterium]|nr:VIT1/CCC1 transporter family protein [Bacilli bacterium]
MNKIPISIEKKILKMQKGEITEYHIYQKISKRIKGEENKKILDTIAKDEYKHFKILSQLLGTEVKPNRMKVLLFSIINFFFGFTFTLKIMESGEENAQDAYEEIAQYYPIAKQIMSDEDTHEAELLNMLNEERLNYVGSMVLGLNDALVELSGTLAGLTFALANTTLISLSGLITGIAASLSMAASEYLSAKSDNDPNALKSAIYTGIAYIITVAILILPYLLISNPYISLGIMLGSVVLIILVFNYYISVAKNYNFKKRFLQMAAISLGVATLSFLIGILVKQFLGVNI